MADSIRVAVVGATGYGGAEIVRLLANHPHARVTTVTSSRLAGRPLREECPWLGSDLILSTLDPERLDADFVVLAQENGFAMEHAAELLPHARIIDLSADFRLTDLDVYKQYYKRDHANPTLPTTPVYSIPELTDHAQIAQARLLANPGCYPTATLLALTPLAKAGLIAGTPVVDAKSGVSGAGRSKKDTEYLYSELAGGFKAYGITGHRHTPEIEQGIGRAVRFTPHLVPMTRGIHATCHVPLTEGHTKEALTERFRDFYAGAKFVRVVSAPPSTKQVQGSNRCDIHVDYDERTGMAIVISVIDNLVKGMAGEAIQNLNIMAGLPEETGLPLDAVWP
ncbi:MAG: N-acetyl-gamma-glutamyl-phosphate reductase [Fimbriimonas sp.]